MDAFGSFNSFLVDIKVTLSLREVAFLLVMQSVCMIMGKNKLGLMVTYIFVAYWGFVLNHSSFVSHFGETLVGTYVYIFCSILLVGAAIFGLFKKEHH